MELSVEVMQQEERKNKQTYSLSVCVCVHASINERERTTLKHRFNCCIGNKKPNYSPIVCSSFYTHHTEPLVAMAGLHNISVVIDQSLLI